MMARQSHVDMVGKVNSLKANLDERYKEFFCVIQELLQNADDAAATQVIIGQLDNLSDKHKLCKGPGIFVINNGPVTDSDLDHIFSIADSNKGEDASKIGKFGLGMKSVFHLCEAFFIFGNQSTGTQEPKILEFFDPWDNKDNPDAMPPPHPDWRSEFERNNDSLWDDIQAFLNKYHALGDNWFGLWLPLRQKEQCLGGSGAMLDYYPLDNGSQEWLSVDDFRKISGMMPFFKHLRKVSFVAGWLEKFGSLEMLPSNNSAFTGKQKNEWTGMIVSDKGILGDVTYHGWEWYEHKELDILRKNDLWPITKCWDSDSRCWHDQKDKTAPHSAICYCTEKLKDSAGNGVLKLQECVFLPLSDMSESKELKLPYHITISFHAQYFVDAGRRRYKLENDKSVADIKVKWNKILRSQLLLPKTLQTLSDYFKDWAIEDIKRFLRVFIDSDFWGRSKEDICRKSQFLLTLTKSGWTWKREDADANFIFLPAVERAELREQIYERINKQYLLVQENSPRLGIKQESHWPAEQAAKLWDAVNALDDKSRYDTTTLNFLEEAVRVIEVREKQIPKIQKFIGGISMLQYRNSKDQIGRILCEYPHCNVQFAKDNWTVASFELWKRILVLASGCLPLDLPAENNPKFQYSEDDLQNMLPELEARLQGESDPNCRAVMRDLVCSIFRNSHVDCSCSVLANFKLFELSDRLFSFSELYDMYKDLHLFRQGGDISIMPSIRKAVQWRIETLPQHYWTALEQYLPIEVFSAKQHIDRIFATNPKLSEPSARMDLLKRLKAEPDHRLFFSSVRYLLHGQAAYSNYMDEIEITDISTRDQELFEIGEKLLRGVNSNKPQFDIPAELIAIFSEAEMANFRIKKSRFETIIRKLGNFDPSQQEDMCKSWRTPDSWFHLVRNLYAPEELQLISQLPIWPCVTGQYTGLNTECYLEQDIAIPAILSSKIHQLAISDPEKIELLCRRLPKIIQVWRDSETVRYCTQLEWTEECVETIWEAVGAPEKAWSMEELRCLYTYKLFETNSHRWISFLQIMSKFDWPSAELYSIDSLTPKSLSRWTKLADCGIPEKSEWTRYLSEILSKDSEFSFGHLPESLCDIEKFRKLFMDHSLMPVLSLLDELAGKIDAGEFLRQLDGTATSSRLAEICTYITKRIAQCNDPLFMEYLGYFIEEAKEVQVDWELVSLPNISGKSRLCSELIRQAEGIEPQYILHPELRKFFVSEEGVPIDGAGLPQSADSNNLSQAEFTEQTENCGKKLQEYFSKWPAELHPGIGTFMLLAGNNQSVQEAAKEYVDREAQILWGNISEDFAAEIEKHTLIVKIFREQSLKVKSLAGTEISVPLQSGSEVESLLIGDDWYNCRFRRYPKEFVFMALRPVEVDNKEVGEKLLINTAKKLVGLVKNSPVENVTKLFEEMRETEQFDLETTRSLILKELPTILRTMNLRGDSELKDVLRDWNNNNKVRTQAEQQGKTDFSKYDKKFQEILDELKELFAKEKIRNETLTAIRRRISTAEYGYEVDSIPFEIFQNADDAAVELQMMQGVPPEQKKSRQVLVIELTDRTLNVTHWGRPINQYQYPGFDHGKGTKYGFGDDLQKMLLLGVSDKSEEGLQRTGKFGLGFKSLFLLTDEPLIASNRLFFSIQGGLLPKPAEAKEREILKSIEKGIGDLCDTKKKLTIFHIPLLDGVNFDLKKFKSAAPLLIRFSRKINEICIIDSSGRQTIRSKESDSYALWDLGSVKLAIGKDNGLPTRLPQKLATIWVTAPSQVTQNFGFAVNGDFCIDVGRNQLLKCDENIEIARQGAEALFKLLESNQNEHPGFWKSLWDLFSNGENSGLWTSVNTDAATSQVLRSLFWGSNTDGYSGYGKFLRHHKVLPAGLSGKYSVLTALDQVRWAADEDLTTFWDLFAELTEKQNWCPGEVIGYSVAQALDNIYGKISWQSLSIATLFSQCAKQTPDLTPSMLNGKKWSLFINKCGSRYQDDCTGLKFLNQEGKYCFPAELLILMGNEKEESRRAAFAPKSALLSDKYDSEAVELFRYARKKIGINIETMGQWAVNAQGKQRDAICQYLDDGELHKQFAQEIEGLLPLLPENWLEEYYRSHPCERGLKYLFLDRLQGGESLQAEFPWQSDGEPQADDEDIYESSPDSEELLQAQSSPETFWQKIAAEWSLHANEEIRKYNRKLYGTEQLEPFPFDSEMQENRDRWLQLFALGAAHSLGRTKLEQHSGFIRWCKENEYWDTFIAPTIVADQWLKVLDKHIESNNPEYGYWLRLYPCIYLFAKYLDDYVEMLHQWSTQKEIASWKLLAEYKDNPMYRGTDFSMPDLKMGLGDIGRHFVFRELWRSNTLRVSGLEKYCFVHSQQNRRYFNGDVNSEKMYDTLKEHLDDPTFDGQFDVAFGIIYR